MRKRLACLLAAALLLTQVLSAGWDVAIASEVAGAAETGGVTDGTPTGQVDVLIEPALILERETTFTVSLDGREAAVHQEGILTLEKDGDVQNKNMQKEALFTELEPGDYDLKVTAPGFADYHQTVSVGTQAVSLRLMTGRVQGFNYQSGAHPGVILIGDVNKDGIVDEQDVKRLTDAVDANKGSSGQNLLAEAENGEVLDLNGDGEVNLVDLQYLAVALGLSGEAGSNLATLETYIPQAAITVEKGENTEITGDPGTLLKKEGSVTLTPQTGKEISADNTVSIDFDFSGTASVNEADGIVIETANDSIRQAVLEISYTEEDGSVSTGGGIEIHADEEAHTVKVPLEAGVHHLLEDERISVNYNRSGNTISIHLGSQIAIKKVTLTISGMVKNNNLAEISRVEFVNGMEKRIPEPEMDIPQNVKADPGSKQFTVTWDPCNNVTGYEVKIEKADDPSQSEVRRVTGNSLQVTSLLGKDLENKTKYTVSVQSVNGTWRSGYSDVVSVIPKADKRPDRPDGLGLTGQYKSISASWKNVKDADYYNLYYKEKQESSYKKIENIQINSYTITDLKDQTEYTVYVTAVNEIGESSPSLTGVARTTDMNPAVMPKYGLINDGEGGEKGAHIISAATKRSNAMHGSPLDSEQGTVWGTVDKNPDSYYLINTWDDGGFNAMNSNHGLFYEFDQPYELQKIALTEYQPLSPNYGYARVRYWDGNGKEETLSASVSRKLDKENRPYYLLTLPKKVSAKKLQIGLARSVASGSISVSEVYFYHYDVLAEKIMSLYADDLHMELKPEVTQETIDELRTRLNTPDEISGELNPDQALLARELQNAEEILNNKELGGIVQIYSSISTNDVNRGFGGLNAWQPIGVTAAAGESVCIYVGHNTKKTGENTNLQLIATQYHAESSSVSRFVANLKVGMNIVDIPKLQSIDAEAGGALYVQYTGNNANDRYAVRASGGAKVPRLDLYRVTDHAERLKRAEAYLEELREYTANMKELHDRLHAGSDHVGVSSYAYSERDCILGATDILMEDMMLSLPAIQVLNGCGSGSTAEQAERLVRSMDAVEGMMNLFYQHKGLNDNAENDKDKTPKQHLNIRYQRMFAGAFMYAAGNHIGIEWPETAGMMGGVPVTSGSEGQYESGQYFGWGISHEIGHCINQGAYAVAEVTNNYFALLTQSKDTNNSVRVKYDKIYEKVTSGTAGPASNVFTQLGMYWQLHLAYDNSYNYKTYEKYEDQLKGFFFARVDTYARDVSKAPKPNGVALTLSGDKDQDLMRLSCAAAEKNILEFFIRWGKTPDAGTIAYAVQFAKETRAIYYASDDARSYRLSRPDGSVLGTAGAKEAVGTGTRAEVSQEQQNRVDFVLESVNIPAEDVLGYEIVRCMISGGEVEKNVVGFATGSTFSDCITTINNRVVSYEVTLIDKYLNRSKTAVLPALKIQHDGSIDKTGWTIGADGLTAVNEPGAGTGNDDTPCAPPADDPLGKIIDQNTATSYTGTAQANAEITIDFHKNQVISGFKYTSDTAGGDYTLYVRAENGEWTKAASGTLGANKTVYFENPSHEYVSTYRTDAVKLALKGTQGRTVTIAELDVLAVTGDNVDFRTAGDGTVAIGRLKESYQYGTEAKDVIPAGSILFTGSYKGNPAYNVVMLFDQDGNQVTGQTSDGNQVSNQIILANKPSGEIQNVSDGTWIYWIEPDEKLDLSKIKEVRAELYRVNDAQTNEGQRLVSDSLFRSMPEVLPDITLTGKYGGQQ